MSVFATNYFETVSDDIDVGNNWNPVDTQRSQTGPGRSTKSDITTRGGTDSDTDTDQPRESSNSASGAMVA